MIAPVARRGSAPRASALTGPHSADTLFHPAARARYDAAVCMYHDQALIPIKTIDFDGGVNVTLGLDFVRTSPDHGTAYDIAGRGLRQPREPDRRARAGARRWARPGRARRMSLAPDGLPPLREVIAAHGLSARKALGQNFLLDLNLTGKIARRAGDLAACDVLEIGPGPGGLTRALLAEGARHVVAIERDAALPAGAGRDRRRLARPADRARGRRAGARPAAAPDAAGPRSWRTCPTTSAPSSWCAG